MDIAIDKFVVGLKDELLGIKRLRPIRVHAQMDNGLRGKEIRRAGQRL